MKAKLFKCLILAVILSVNRGDCTNKEVKYIKPKVDYGKVVVDIKDGIKTQYLKQNVDIGAYDFGYDISPSGPFHYENRGPNNVTYGCHGYINAFGMLMATSYVADGWGYRVVKPYKPVKVYPESKNGKDYNHNSGLRKTHGEGVLADWQNFPKGCLWTPGNIPIKRTPFIENKGKSTFPDSIVNPYLDQSRNSQFRRPGEKHKLDGGSNTSRSDYPGTPGTPGYPDIPGTPGAYPSVQSGSNSPGKYYPRIPSKPHSQGSSSADGKETNSSSKFHYQITGQDNVTYGCHGHKNAAGWIMTTYFVTDRRGKRPVKPHDPIKVYPESKNDKESASKQRTL